MPPVGVAIAVIDSYNFDYACKKYNATSTDIVIAHRIIELSMKINGILCFFLKKRKSKLINEFDELMINNKIASYIAKYVIICHNKCVIN
jgi:hypothetical protein